MNWFLTTWPLALTNTDLLTSSGLNWESLSPREQDVTALSCLGFTNRQIAARLSLSPETIKTHVRNVLSKFGINSKSELRHILAGWDFSAWL